MRTDKAKFLQIKVQIWKELTKYKNSNFSVTGTYILFMNIKKALNHCNRY